MMLLAEHVILWKLMKGNKGCDVCNRKLLKCKRCKIDIIAANNVKKMIGIITETSVIA